MNLLVICVVNKFSIWSLCSAAFIEAPYSMLCPSLAVWAGFMAILLLYHA